jgi:cytochrome b561
LQTRYNALAITLHWLIFILVASGFALALYMTELPLSPQKLRYISWHKWIGVTVFALALARVGWRLAHPAPPLADSIPPWQRSAANATHLLLYALIVAIPLSGWLMSSAAGVPTVYLGIIPLPNPLARDKELAELIRSVHALLNYTLLALVIVHVAAALKHHFIDRDDVLARMLPLVKPREGL